jgi:hypothetical protein
MRTCETTVVIAMGAALGGIGLGLEAMLPVFSPGCLYSTDGGESWQSISTHYMISTFFQAFLKGWLPALLCLPMMPLILWMVSPPRGDARRRFPAAGVWGMLGAVYGVLATLLLWVIVGG